VWEKLERDDCASCVSWPAESEPSRRAIAVLGIADLLQILIGTASSPQRRSGLALPKLEASAHTYEKQMEDCWWRAKCLAAP
jgi:hypothetical protein